MRQLDIALGVLPIAICLTGCATSALKMAPERSDRPWQSATTSAGEIIAGEPTKIGMDYQLPANEEAGKVPAPLAVATSKPYSLAELIDIAESNNPLTRIAWNDARRVALAEGIAESTYLPNIAATAVAAYQGSSGHGSATGFGASGNGSAEGVISAISVQWLLFDFGERDAVVDAAKQASVVSNIAFTASHQQVIYNVSLAFYAHAAAVARGTTAAQSLNDAEAVQASAEDRRKHGIGTIVEVAQARQGTAQANLAVVQANGAEKDTYLSLIAALGISPLTQLKIADVSGRKLSPAMSTPVETTISQALARRPDLLSAYAAQKASLAHVQAAEADFLPKFFISATGAYNSGRASVSALPSVGQQAATENISGSHLNGNILAGVTVPLYDGGMRSAVLAQAKAKAENADAKLTQVRDEAVRQIVLADNALRTNLAAHEAAEALAGAAQTTFDAALAAYRNGVGSITDATLAESQLLQARNATSDAYSTALSAAATLALSTGALGAAPD